MRCVCGGLSNAVLMREGGDVSLSADPSGSGVQYTVTEDDVSGIQFKCSDAVHTSWTKGNTDLTSRVIQPICTSLFSTRE